MEIRPLISISLLIDYEDHWLIINLERLRFVIDRLNVCKMRTDELIILNL